MHAIDIMNDASMHVYIFLICFILVIFIQNSIAGFSQPIFWWNSRLLSDDILDFSNHLVC